MKKIIYVDMDDVLCQFTKAYKAKLIEEPEIAYPQSQYGFFRNLSPLEDAINSIQYLTNQSTFDVYILTAPSVLNPLCYTEKRVWVEENLGMQMVNKLIISPNKGLNKGDYLIDDHDTGRGQEDFEGTLIHFGKTQFPNWPSVIQYFKSKYSL